ncbi:unnamed protein product [Clonostachys byssicola]|uniref:Uncharacterized protein n=1 Tax=Clonostachys byssicola TaxID=160290 RepID=A0A9N9UTE6_9HYPO|nr:unnamed protein product [Clonostachys byssicola]
MYVPKYLLAQAHAAKCWLQFRLATTAAGFAPRWNDPSAMVASPRPASGGSYVPFAGHGPLTWTPPSPTIPRLHEREIPALGMRCARVKGNQEPGASGHGSWGAWGFAGLALSSSSTNELWGAAQLRDTAPGEPDSIRYAAGDRSKLRPRNRDSHGRKERCDKKHTFRGEIWSELLQD